MGPDLSSPYLARPGRREEQGGLPALGRVGRSRACAGKLPALRALGPGPQPSGQSLAWGWGAVLSLHFPASLGKLGRESLLPSGLCPGSSSPPAPGTLGQVHPLTCCASGQAETQVTPLHALTLPWVQKKGWGTCSHFQHLSCYARGAGEQGRASTPASGSPGATRALQRHRAKR